MASLVLFVVLPTLLTAEYYPSYSVQMKVCSTDSECDSARGEVCYKYDGCELGQCRCRPASHVYDPTADKCVRVTRYGDRCDHSPGSCSGRLRCRAGRCRCPQGQATDDGEFCYKLNERFLGQQCVGGLARDADKCYRKATVYGYTQNTVVCAFGFCQCVRGTKVSGKTCRKYRIEEQGCLQNFYCEGGALCKDERCVCPEGTIAIHGNSRCAPKNAKFNVMHGHTCDEQQRKSYCARGLLCHRCPGEGASKCVRLLSSNAKVIHQSLTSTVGILLTAFILTPIS